MEHILAAVDNDKSAKNVISAAGKLAKQFGAKLTICHVMKGPSRESRELQGSLQQDLYLKVHASMAKEIATGYANSLSDYGIPVIAIGLVGNVSREIVNCAKELEVDLLIMGLNPLEETHRVHVLASTSKWVLEHTPCPILFVTTARVSNATVST